MVISQTKSPFLTMSVPYVGKTCYVVHRLDMETALVLLCQNLIPPIHRLLEKKKRFLGILGTS